MYAFRFNGVVSQQFIFLLKFFFVGQVRYIFQFRELSGDVGKNEQSRIFRITGNQIYTFICQVYTVQLFVNYEIQRVSNLVHTLVVLLHVDFFRLEHTGFDTLLTEELNQSLVLRQTLVAAIQRKESFFHLFLVIRCDKFLGFGQVFGCQYFLCFY